MSRASDTVVRRRLLRVETLTPLAILVGGAVVALAAREGGIRPLGVRATGWWSFGMLVVLVVYGLRRRWLPLSIVLLRPFARIDALHPLLPTARALDRLETWRAVHLVVGVVWALFLWWHVDQARGSWPEQVLLVLCGLLLVSGVVGTAIQWWLPRRLLRSLVREVRIEDVDARRNETLRDAEDLVRGRGERLVDTYLEQIRPALQGETPRRRLLEALLRGHDPGALLRGRLLGHLERFDEEDAAVLRRLIDLVEQKGRLDLNRFQLELSSRWLVVHDALILATVAFVALHVLSVSYY